MKKTLLIFSFMLTLLNLRLSAVESEPNDVRGDADNLGLNGSNTGAVGVPGDVDWWKVTTTSDGKLDITLAVSNGLYCFYQLYDNNATTLLKSSYTSGTQSISVDGLSPGTYFIYIYAYTAGQLPAYTISNALTVAPLTNDPEPNSLYTQAGPLTLNGSSTGHVGYYYDGVRDTIDWWSIVTTGNGELELTMASANGNYVYWVLYDGNGTTVLKSSYTSGTATHVTDGLAAGTYYVKVYCFYSDDFAPYTLTNVFNNPPVANDAEPNNTKAQAKNLPVNNSKTGQVGYYYNGVRDTSDWYKITTDLDGDLKLTIISENGEYVYATLYDKNGTTVLKSEYTSGTKSNITYGLTAGTYYVSMYCFYNHKWADYTITDSLLLPPVVNDVEPNNSKGTAIAFAENSTLTGHVGYYYNLERDTSDWYELVTTEDGQIEVTLTPEIGEYVYATLYDEDGTTVLASHYSSSNTLTSKDGLAAGTYYVRVYCFYTNKYAPYTISNVVNTYMYADDGISNDEPKKAATLPANIGVDGHVNFRYNGGTLDVSDWWKINYTGNSDLTVSLVWQPRLCCGNQYVYLRVYADTAAAPIYNQYTSGGSLTANFTGLEKQYYYVQVITYYTTEYAAYNITATFTQKEKAKITLLSSAAGTDCTDGMLEYKCTKSEKPYTVQLFRNGKKFGNPFLVKNSTPFVMDTLLPGNYYATVYGDGATGQGKGTSVTVTIVPVPTGLSTSKIKTNKAQLNWDTLACIDYDSVYYRVVGTTTWTKKETSNNNSAYTITGLSPSTNYEWMVAHVVDTSGEKATSSYSGIVSFTTKPLKLGEDEMSGVEELAVFPNPAAEATTVRFNSNTTGEITFKLVDAVGHSLESWTLQAEEGEYVREINLSTFAAGIYYLRVTTDSGDKIVKIVKQ